MSRRARAAAIVAVVAIVDRATKIYIQETFSLLDSVAVIPGFFNIVRVENPGAAWGMLADAEWRGLVLVWISLAVMAVIGVMLWKPKPAGAPETPLVDTGLALVFGGALGNLWDRLFRGTVTDFVQLFFGSYEYPSFNVADSAIFVGAVLLVVDMWRGRRAQKQQG
jgi:signal peptidase II